MSHHTKQKRTEHLPLSSAALELLKTIKESRGEISDFVFPWPIARSTPKGPKGLLEISIGDGGHF
jgi:hypothetical protein